MGDISSIQRFVAAYVDKHPALETTAKLLREELGKRLVDANIALHVVSSRAKTADSVRAKLLSKAYSDPANDMTDQVGVRVIVYRSQDVDMAAQAVRGIWKVIKKHSIDKRRALGLREFGYRSFHLVCEIPKKVRDQAQLPGGPRYFEVQIRSILEHAWAEIEHGVVYKSGADLPADIKRRFASAAGVLELLENEFRRISDDSTQLVDSVKAEMAGGAASRPLDVPNLLALLEINFPVGRSFRAAAVSASPFPPGIERRFVLALKKCGIKSTHGFSTAINGSEFQVVLSNYAAAEGLAIDEVSHLAICVLLIGLKKKSYLQVFFPDYWSGGIISALS